MTGPEAAGGEHAEAGVTQTVAQRSNTKTSIQLQK